MFNGLNNKIKKPSEITFW